MPTATQLDELREELDQLAQSASFSRQLHGVVAGELDIDSHLPAAFTSEDRELVEYCAALLGRHLEKFPA